MRVVKTGVTVLGTRGGAKAEGLTMHLDTYFSHDAAAWVSIGCVILMIAAPFALIYWAKVAERPYIGTGMIYFLAISEIIPAIVILGLQQVLGKEAAGTLLAGVAGYVLGGMSDSKQQKNNNSGGGGDQKPTGKPDPNAPDDSEDVPLALKNVAAAIQRE